MFESIYLSLGPAGSAVSYFISGVVVSAVFAAFVLQSRGQQLQTAQAKIGDAATDIEELEATLRQRETELTAAREESGHQRDRISRLEGKTERLSELESRYEKLSRELVDERRLKATLETRLKERERALSEQIEQLNKSRDSMKTEFQNLANQILEEKGTRFSKEQSERLQGLLNPLKTQITEFQNRVNETHKDTVAGRATLEGELKNLRKLNERLGAEAENLALALKGNPKTRGNWGEMKLVRLLEESGLQEGLEYECEQHHRDADNRIYRPDVVVHAPGGRDIVVDAKVALNAYLDFTEADSEAEQKAAMNRHIAALRGHAKQLAAKDYGRLKGVNTLDFVILFVPVESAFIDAIRYDRDLWDSVFSSDRIIIASPTTLLAILRTISVMWQIETRNRNAEDIADRAGRLYDKFVNFSESLVEVGAQIDKARGSYDKAIGQLSSGSGNLVRQVEMLKKLGAKTSKRLPRELALETEDA